MGRWRRRRRRLLSMRSRFLCFFLAVCGQVHGSADDACRGECADSGLASCRVGRLLGRTSCCLVCTAYLTHLYRARKPCISAAGTGSSIQSYEGGRNTAFGRELEGFRQARHGPGVLQQRACISCSLSCQQQQEERPMPSRTSSCCMVTPHTSRLAVAYFRNFLMPAWYCLRGVAKAQRCEVREAGGLRCQPHGTAQRAAGRRVQPPRRSLLLQVRRVHEDLHGAAVAAVRVVELLLEDLLMNFEGGSGGRWLSGVPRRQRTRRGASRPSLIPAAARIGAARAWYTSQPLSGSPVASLVQ